MEARADYSNNQYANAGEAHGYNRGANSSRTKEKNNYDTQANRAAGENISKKKGFSFIQKAGLTGAAITGGLFFIKSKILTFLSFLTAIPTAGLLYFGFMRGGKKTQAAQPEPQPVKKPEPRLSPETLDNITDLNNLKQESNNPLLKEFVHNTVQAMAITNNFNGEDLAHELINKLDYQLNKDDLRKLQTQLHPDKHAKAPDGIKDLYDGLFRTVGAYKDIALAA